MDSTGIQSDQFEIQKLSVDNECFRTLCFKNVYLLIAATLKHFKCYSFMHFDAYTTNIKYKILNSNKITIVSSKRSGCNGV